jgi:DNA-binding Lrp family transcriptional regulator
VAHNYRRDHPLNMWFVLAASSTANLEAAMQRIRSLTGLWVCDFPKRKEYHLGFWLHLDPNGGVGLRRIEREVAAPPSELDELDRAIVATTQAGLPVAAEPFAAIAARTGCDTSTVIHRLRRMLQGGAIRRIGAVPNHYRLGLRANGMSVWDLDDQKADSLGAEIGALEFVTHCYLRPRRLPLWPYNLFAMVHGRDRGEVRAATAHIEQLVAGHCRGRDLLFSQAILKKSGLRILS